MSSTYCLAYNSGGHRFITLKALNEIAKTQNSRARLFRPDIHSLDIREGVLYADAAPPKCVWEAKIGMGGPLVVTAERLKIGCDTIHHYIEQQDIESVGISECVGHPGEVTADVYADILLKQAVLSWPGGAEPDLKNLPYLDAGFVEGGDATILDLVSFGLLSDDPRLNFYKNSFGGEPLCEAQARTKLIRQAKDDCMKASFPPGCYTRQVKEIIQMSKFDGCPKWPSWGTNPHSYLGWTAHLIQDATVPYHINNTATPGHQDFEDMVDKNINKKRYDHLPVSGNKNYVFYGKTQNLGACRIKYKKGINPYSPKTYAVDIAPGVLVRDIANWVTEANKNIEVLTTSGNLLSAFPCKIMTDIAIGEVAMDAAIKQSVELIELFYYEVSKQSDPYEPNDNPEQAQYLNSDLEQVTRTIHNESDEDYFYFHFDKNYESISLGLETHAAKNLYDFYAEKATIKIIDKEVAGHVVHFENKESERIESKPTAYGSEITVSGLGESTGDIVIVVGRKNNYNQFPPGHPQFQSTRFIPVAYKLVDFEYTLSP